VTRLIRPAGTVPATHEAPAALGSLAAWLHYAPEAPDELRELRERHELERPAADDAAAEAWAALASTGSLATFEAWRAGDGRGRAASWPIRRHVRAI
jgi:hypothetical protein